MDMELKEAICRKFKRDNNLEYKPANIVVSTGANNLYTIFKYFKRWRRSNTPAPYWVSTQKL
jgi:aspartate aminotransferase